MIRVKKPLSAMALIALSLLVLASCASKPKAPAAEPAVPAQAAPAEPAPTAAPAAGPSQEDLDQLLAQAKELKKKAFDLQLFEVLPDDYKAAEALFNAGQKAYDDKDAPAAKKGLDEAIAAYKDLIAKGVVEFAGAKKKEAEDMKAAAVKAGADSSQTERFGSGDEAYSAALALFDDKKVEESIPGFERATLYYELSLKRANAADLKQAIDDKDFAKWDSGNYQLADEKYQSEEGLWASGKDEDRKAGIDALNESILRFNLVTQKGKEMAAGAVRDKTDVAKQRADEIKADVAVKDMYGSALNLYQDAAGAFGSQDYDKASEDYGKAGSAFEEAYAAAAEKRLKAQEAMKAAAEATSESQRKAEEADPLVQGSAKN